MWMAVLGLILLLSVASAINQARKGRWYTAGGILFPTLGIDLMVFGAVERQSLLLFRLGIVLAVVGFGMEFMAYWRTRASGAERDA
ncbi:hypothetical protein [Streptomyces sp. NBC_01217]|uniref:hypothetical protein n=1 Tax=Streptomyces sp. NBC_01217 TaxID=2903779 RepID=UPI002E11936C|nr:hypothetical protein OG507_16945 [Streptomyces sp. NBC_01217]